MSIFKSYDDINLQKREEKLKILKDFMQCIDTYNACIGSCDGNCNNCKYFHNRIDILDAISYSVWYMDHVKSNTYMCL